MDRRLVNLADLRSLVCLHLAKYEDCLGHGQIDIVCLEGQTPNWGIEAVGIGSANAHSLSMAASEANHILSKIYNLECRDGSAETRAQLIKLS